MNYSAQWSGTKFGMSKIYTGSDLFCLPEKSLSVLESLKLKSGTWGFKKYFHNKILMDFPFFSDFFSRILAHLL